MKNAQVWYSHKGLSGVTPGAILIAMLLLSPQAHAKYDWLQFGFLPDKTGNNTLETNLTLGNVGSLQPLFTVPLGHNPDGAPVLLTGVNTPSGVRDLIFIFAEQGYTTAFDANTGAQVWTKDYSTGAAGHSSNTSPAVDPNRLYVYTFGMDGNAHKLNVGDGSEVTGGGWPERIMNDNGKARGAFTIAMAANGHTYLYGNAEGTKGHMTTIDLGTGTQHVFNTANAQSPDTHSPSGSYGEANPWSRGPAYNAALDRVFFTTGTFANFVAGHDWVESLLGMAPDGHTDIIGGGGYPVDSYTPSAWQTYINQDGDLGSANIIQLPTGLSSKYPNLAVMGSKDKMIRIFNLANLSGQGGPGHTGGELQQIAGPVGGLIRSQGTTWTDPATSKVWVFVPGDGGICGLQVAIDGSGNPTLVTKWTLKNGWTTSAIMANGVLFAAMGGGEHTDTTSTHTLQAINPITGAVIWSSAIGQFHWESPIVANGIVYMCDGNSGGFGSGTGGNLRAWSMAGGGGGVPNSLSINFSGTGGTGTNMATTEFAGVVPHTHWNNELGLSGSNVPLMDNNGAFNGATLTFNDSKSYSSTTIANTAGNNRMMKFYLDSSATTTTTVTVTNLPADSNGYKVYVYFDGNNNETREGAYTISGTGITTTTINGFDNANIDFSGTFTQANNNAGNYVVFTIGNVSGFTVSATAVANGATYPRGPLNGIQIVPQ